MKKQLYIIVPVYNGEKYIERCILSILSQSYHDFIVIFVDDGSIDNTYNILKKYESNNFFVLKQKNKGVSAARNVALDFIKEEDCYISFLDADDYIDNDYFETLVNGIENNKVDIYCCSYTLQKENSSRKIIQIDRDSKLNSFKATELLVSDRSIQSHSPCKIYNKYVWNDVRYPVGVAWMEDQATIFKTFYNAKKGIYISNYSGYHYWQGESACRGHAITNKRFFDSVFGYLEPYTFDYANYSESEKNTLKMKAGDALVNTYLMLLPYIKKSQFSIEEKNKYKEIKFLIKNNKLIRKFHPLSKKEKMKKAAYLYARPFYSFLYKLFS